MMEKVNKMQTCIASMMLTMLLAVYGCPALVIAYIVYNNDNDNVTATVEIPRSADAIFASALKLANTGPKSDSFTVKQVDQTNYFMRVESNDNQWWFELTLVALNENTTQLIMVGVSPGDEEEQTKRGLSAIEQICDDLNVKYRVVENVMPSTE